MEKKESPRESPKTGGGLKSKMAGFSGGIFGIIKFILGICLLPFVYAVSVSFLQEFCLVDKAAQGYFWAGVIGLLITRLFIYEPAIIYQKGFRLIEIIFSFFAPLVRVAPYLLPIYFIVIFSGYLLFSALSKGTLNYFFVLFGLSITLHLIFSAKTLRAKQQDFLKANYIFGFSFVYIINLALLAFCFNLIFKDFSFVNFFNNSFQSAKGIFAAVFKQLFVP